MMIIRQRVCNPLAAILILNHKNVLQLREEANITFYQRKSAVHTGQRFQLVVKTSLTASKLKQQFQAQLMQQKQLHQPPSLVRNCEHYARA